MIMNFKNKTDSKFLSKIKEFIYKNNNIYIYSDERKEIWYKYISIYTVVSILLFLIMLYVQYPSLKSLLFIDLLEVVTLYLLSSMLLSLFAISILITIWLFKYSITYMSNIEFNLNKVNPTIDKRYGSLEKLENLYDYVFNIKKDYWLYNEIISEENKRKIKMEFITFIGLLEKNIDYNFQNNSEIIKTLKKMEIELSKLELLDDKYNSQIILNLNKDEFNQFLNESDKLNEIFFESTDINNPIYKKFLFFKQNLQKINNHYLNIINDQDKLLFIKGVINNEIEIKFYPNLEKYKDEFKYFDNDEIIELKEKLLKQNHNQLILNKIEKIYNEITSSWIGIDKKTLDKDI